LRRRRGEKKGGGKGTSYLSKGKARPHLEKKKRETFLHNSGREKKKRKKGPGSDPCSRGEKRVRRELPA